MAIAASGTAFDEAVEYALGELQLSHVKLKEKQLDVLEHVYNGKDVFGWLPTGYGKSICYQILPFLFDYKLGKCGGDEFRSVVVVVSPLVSLMTEQVRKLRQCGVSCAILAVGTGGSSYGSERCARELLVKEEDFTSGSYRILYSSPEAVIGNVHWREMLLKPPYSHTVVAVAVDEAHCVSKWSKEFRPIYGRVAEIRALVPSGVPMLALTSTVTDLMRKDAITSLDMEGCEIVSLSPNRPNIFYEVKHQSDIEMDMAHLVSSIQTHSITAERVIVYCRTIDLCADLYAHILHSLGESSYFPLGSEQVSDNRLFGMYHSNTPFYNKQVILQSLSVQDGIVRVVFATNALGMGVNMAGVNTIIHYGAPSSIDDYLQESGRAGRSGDQASSVVYWKPVQCPLRKEPETIHEIEVNAVRQYLENCTSCRRRKLLRYFDLNLAVPDININPLLCCDVCRCSAQL